MHALSGRAAAERFVQLIAGSSDAAMAWRLIRERGSSSCLLKKGAIASVWEAFQDAQQDGYGVFAVVNEGGQCDAQISKVRALFIDSDGVSLNSVRWHVAPHFIARRTDTHWHAYWLVSDLPTDGFRDAQRRLAQNYGTDPTVCNLSRVMRLPGSKHLKHPNEVFDFQLMDSQSGAERWELEYTAAEVLAGLPECLAEAPASKVSHPGPAISLARFREILSFIDPTFADDQNRWAGLAKAIRWGDVSVQRSEEVNWEELLDDWCSGRLWRERTKTSFEVTTYKGRDELLARTCDPPRHTGPRIGIGTFIRLAVQSGYREFPSLLDLADATTARPTESAYPESHDQSRWPPLMHVGARAIQNIAPPEYFISEFMPAHGFGGNLAVRGTGKTVLGMDLLLRAASDKSWHGIPMLGGFYAIAFVGEDIEGAALNVEAWANRSNGGTVPSRFVLVNAVPDLRKRQDCLDALKHIKLLIGGDARAVCMIDTWQRATTGAGQNDDEEMARAAENAELLSRELRGPVLCNFHPPKANPDTIMGSSVIENATTFILSTKNEVGGVLNLEVVRVKGPGCGNSAKFRFETVGLGRFDSFGREQSGVVPIRMGGTEVRSAQDEKRREWAKRIRGVLETVGDAMSVSRMEAELGGKPYTNGDQPANFPRGGEFRTTASEMFAGRPFAYPDGATLELVSIHATRKQFRLRGAPLPA